MPSSNGLVSQAKLLHCSARNYLLLQFLPTQILANSSLLILMPGTAVISQVDGQGRVRVVAYGSRLLSKPERQYCVTRRELLAVVFFIDQFHPYLLGYHFLL